MSHVVFGEPVDGAMWLRNRGFKVFPIVALGKTPLIKSWQEWAEKATDLEVQKFAQENLGCNWGVHLSASGHFVIDLDEGWKDSGNGKLVLRKGFSEFTSILESSQEKLGRTLTVRTPSGGYHIYFKHQGRNTAGALGTNIDTRGQGGYVLAPGSVTNFYQNEKGSPAKGKYLLEKSYDPIELPDWLAKKLGETKKQAPVLEEAVPEGQRNHTLASFAGTMRARGVGYEVIKAALSALNQNQFDVPVSEEEVEEVARSICRYEPSHAKTASDFIAKPESEITIRTLSSIDPTLIPKRDWILRNCYLGKFITLIVSPGGVGKSTISLLDGLSVASGINLSGYDVVKPGPVMIYNAEDPLEELERRAVAMADYHQLDRKTFNNLFLISGRSNPFLYAKNGDFRETVLNEEAISFTSKMIQERGIKLFIADPFVRTHSVNENDNMAIDKVAQAFQRIATNTGCAICLIHHTSKAASKAEDSADANLSRGASALVNAARIAQTLTPMRGPEEAVKAGIPPSQWKFFFRRENAKANLSKPTEFADWYRRDEIQIANGEMIGVCTVADLRQKMDAKISAMDALIQDAVKELAPGQKKKIREIHPNATNTARARMDIARALMGREDFQIDETYVSRARVALPKPNAEDFFSL